MPGPSTDSSTNQTRGPATPEEQAFASLSLSQAGKALLNYDMAQSPLLRAKTIDQRLAAAEDLVNRTNARQRALYDEVSGSTGAGGWTAERVAENQQLAQTAKDAGSAWSQLQGEKQILPGQVQEAEGTQRVSNLAAGRLEDYLSGKDIGVSAQEQALITQGISGISQDVATTRGLNRTDVPVMQAIAPAVSNALLQQANANRSLFTGINQFQQGMGLSQQQLQSGLAGQNPAANLTGVYAGLRPSSFSTNTQQGYGGLDYVNATANILKGGGAAATGGADAGLW